jgi:hypothetical protein
MGLLSLLLYYWFNEDLYLNQYIFPENIEYCANIMYNPELKKEFDNDCNLDLTNNYILLTKKNY